MRKLLTILLFVFPLLASSQLLRYSEFENTTNFLRYLPSTSGTFFREGIQPWSVAVDGTFVVSPTHSARFELRRTDTGTDSKRAEITIDEITVTDNLGAETSATVSIIVFATAQPDNVRVVYININGPISINEA